MADEALERMVCHTEHVKTWVIRSSFLKIFNKHTYHPSVHLSVCPSIQARLDEGNK